MKGMTIVGVHPIQASEPVHLVVADIDGEVSDASLSAITQPTAGQPRANWQVPYDERVLGRHPPDLTRVAFFFHYLDPSQPFLTPVGEVPIPSPTPLPDHLKTISYEAP